MDSSWLAPIGQLLRAWRAWRRLSWLPGLLLPVLAGVGVAHAQYAPREQTQLDITFTAASDINPDEKGRPAPLLVRVYELKADTVFAASDYFSLQANDKALVGTDLLARDEFILKPGEVKTIRRKSHPELNFIGVLAGYRDLAQTDWRAVHKIDPAPESAWYRMVLPANKVKLQIQLQAKGIRVVPVE